jgi:hypothetical protein
VSPDAGLVQGRHAPLSTPQCSADPRSGSPLDACRDDPGRARRACSTPSTQRGSAAPHARSPSDFPDPRGPGERPGRRGLTQIGPRSCSCWTRWSPDVRPLDRLGRGPSAYVRDVPTTRQRGGPAGGALPHPGSGAPPSRGIVALVVGAGAGHGSARATVKNASRAGAACAGLHMTSIRCCSTSPTSATQRRPSGSDARTAADAGSTPRPSATSANVGSKGKRGVTMRGVNPAAAHAARTAS